MLNFTSSPATQNQTFDTVEEDLTIMPEMLVIFVLLGLLALLIILANSLVFYLALIQPNLRTKTNYFLISLATSDLFSGLLGVPLLVSCNIVNYTQLCLGMDVCQRFLAISAILHLSGAVFERYLKITKPFRHLTMVTKSRIFAVLACIWCISLTVALVQTAWDGAESMAVMNLAYGITLLTVFVSVPYLCSLTAFLLMYVAIKRGEVSRRKMVSRRASSQQPRKKKLLQQKRVVLVYFSMITCFTVGWFPYFFLTLFMDLEYEFVMNIPFWLNVTLLFLKYGTSLANPLLFTFFKADFQKALKCQWQRISWTSASTTSASSGNSAFSRTHALHSRLAPKGKIQRSMDETQI